MVYKLLFLFLVTVSNLFAANGFKDLKSFKADFSQIVANDSNKSVKYTGKIFIKNSGKVLWKYETPIIKNVYVLDGVAIVDEPELEQAIYANLEKEINIIKLLEDAVEIQKGLYRANLYDVNYFIAIKDDKIKSLSYKDELGNMVTINFTNVLQNSQIDDSIFHFLPPDYYDVIKK